MKSIQSFIAVFVLAIFLVSSAVAQKDPVANANHAFKLKKYYEAIALYKKAYTKVKDKAEKARIKFQTAECYRLINDMVQAENWYLRVIKTNYPDPIIFLHYADALKMNQKYEEAIIQYNLYKEKVPDDPAGQAGVDACTLAQSWLDNPTRYEVENQKRFNSKSSDFSPAYADRKFRTIYFTSTREGSAGKGTDHGTGQGFSDVYEVNLDRKGAWSSPEPLNVIINSEVNEGAVCMNAKATTLYFTRCGQEKKKKMGCSIYVANKKGKDWEEPVLLTLAADSFTVGHPSLSYDELTLFFASDMSGGQGGKDIWMVTRDNKKDNFDNKPVNLGPTINTPNDEMYPYIRKDGTLYFSSDGHVGMGGLDIFKSTIDNGEWTKPENLKFPLNSPGDDFGIIFEDEQEKGFLTSNREGDKEEAGGKTKGGDDIWAFYLPPLIFSLQGTIIDDTTKQILPGVLVELVGSDGNSYQDTTDENGFYQFDKRQIMPNTTYELTFSKDGYFTKKGEESTVGLERSKVLVYDESLAPIPKKGIELPEILYDLAKWDLKPEYENRLEGLVITMKDNPKIVIELGSHTDSRPIPMTNKVLSQKRAESCVNYLISKGVAPDRMVAKGYGAASPKDLTKDVVKDGIKFEKGAVLDNSYINALKTTKQKEAAHALNRRTEFRVLRTDYVPKAGGNMEAPKIEIIDIPDQGAPDLDPNRDQYYERVENANETGEGSTEIEINLPAE